MSNVPLALALLALGACSTDPRAGPEPTEPPVVPERIDRSVTSAEGDLGAVVEGNSAFAWDVYGALSGGDDNVFVSPFSMSAALGMTMAGADGDTLTEMSQVLGATLPDADWHPAMGELIRDLNGDFERGYTLYVANRLFGQDGYPFESAFLATCEDDYGAPLAAWDFVSDAEGGRELVNDWVAEQTNDRILELLPPGSVSGDTRLVLANAIYFLADWALPFDPDDTSDGPFTRLDGSRVTAPIMRIATRDHRDAPHEFAEVDGATIVRIPYKDDELSMILVVPEAPDGLPALEAELDADTFESWVAGLERGDFVLRMPRFELRYEVDLVPVLEQLGLSTPFSDATANFDRMSSSQPDGRLFVSGVFHQAFVAVDELGTEAAAATGVVVGPASAPPTVDATHPFLFVLRDDLTGSVLFVGRVADPTAG